MKEIFDIDNWREIGASLMRNKTRSFLTGFGIFWGVLMLVILWSGGNGMEKMIGNQFKGFSTNTAVFWPSSTGENYKGYTKGRNWSFNNRDLDALKHNVNSIELIEPLLRNSANVTYGEKTMNANVYSNSPTTYALQTPKIIRGRVINIVDINSKAKVVVLGTKLAEELLKGEDPIGKFITINGVSYRVIGVMECLSGGGSQSIDEDGVHIPFSTMQAAFNIGDRFWTFTVGFKPGFHASTELPKIQQYVFRNHSISPTDKSAMQMFDLSVMYDSVSMLLLSIRVLAFIVGAGSLISGIIGVGNIMMIIIKERTPEIGIRRAIGAKPIDIVKQILLESLVLTLLAGLSGLSVSVGIMAMVSKTSGESFTITFTESMVILGIFIVLGLAAGVLPARRAMSIKPIEAMHDK